MKKLIILYNPRCSKCHQALDFIRTKGYEPTIRDYLTNPLSLIELGKLHGMLGAAGKSMIRKKEEIFTTLNLDIEDSKSWLAAMASHPQLLERPILISENKAVIGRTIDGLEDFFH